MKGSLFIAVLACISVLSCDAKSKSTAKIGDLTEIRQECLSATTRELHKEMSKISNRRDENALVSMMNSGEVYVLKTGDKVQIVDIRFPIYQVERQKDNLRVWVDHNFVK